MVRFLLPAIVFFLFILEGTVMQVFTPERFGSEFIIIPRFAFMVVIVIAIFMGRTTGTMFALGLGFFQDVIYTHVLGVYMFSMALITYLLGFSFKVFQKNLPLLIVTAIFGTILLDYLVYGIHFMIGITTILHDQFFYERLLPSLVVNSVFLIIFAYPLRKLLLFLKNKDDIEEKIHKRKRDFRWQR